MHIARTLNSKVANIVKAEIYMCTVHHEVHGRV